MTDDELDAVPTDDLLRAIERRTLWFVSLRVDIKRSVMLHNSASVPPEVKRDVLFIARQFIDDNR